MTDQQAERLATLLLGVAVTGATFFVLRTPVLRRAAWQYGRTALLAAGPWLAAEARKAWAESERSHGSSGPPVPAEGRELKGG